MTLVIKTLLKDILDVDVGMTPWKEAQNVRANPKGIFQLQCFGVYTYSS